MSMNIDKKNKYIELLTDADTIWFCIYFGIMLALTSPVMNMISRSWNTESMRYLSDLLRSIDSGIISISISFTIGFFIGSTYLLFRDRYKKVQAFILSIGIILTFKYMFDNYAVNWNIISVLLGSITGVILGNGLKSGRKNDHEQAAKNIVIISLGYLIISFLILNTSPNSDDNVSFILDAFTVLAFSVLLAKLLLYKGSGKNFFVLGPAKSGKTVFLIGCYINMIKLSQGRPIKPNKALTSAYNELSSTARTKSEIATQKNEKDDIKRAEIYESTWISRTEDIVEYSFTYVIGKLFPKELIIKTVDFPGSHIVNIPDYMYSNEKITSDNEAYVKTAKYVTDANKLILVIDGNQYPNFGELVQYIEVVSKLEAHKNTEYYIIVTKSDVFLDEFRQEMEYDQYYRFGNIDYDNFRKFITEKFSKNIKIKALLAEIYNAPIYPVFFETDIYQNTRIPMSDKDANLFIYGFNEFLTNLLEKS